MKIPAVILFSMILVMDICDDNKGEQWVVMRQPSNHNCAAMKATAMGSAAGMTEKLGTYASESQAVSALASFKAQDDPNHGGMKICE
jgi:hypothetical protein